MGYNDTKRKTIEQSIRVEADENSTEIKQIGGIQEKHAASNAVNAVYCMGMAYLTRYWCFGLIDIQQCCNNIEGWRNLYVEWGEDMVKYK